MIGFFPDPYPDELLFSICSRYHERLGYRSRESTGRDLFNAACARVAFDLPCNLDALVAILPHGHRHTVQRFIDENTLLPFYGPFVPPERLPRLRSDMQGDYGSSIHGRLGILTSKINLKHLRFCLLCVKEDREEFKETYWHRLHNVPGIEVCPRHKVFLENTSVYARGRGNSDYFVTAEHMVHHASPRATDDANPWHRAFLQIAEDAAWLLGQQGLTDSPPVHRERYISLLFDRGVSSYNGRVNTHQLVSSLTSHYSTEFLMHLGCGTEKNHNWIQRLVQNTKRAQHPLQHLLLIQFLGLTAEQFFCLSAERLPFGKGPWPCLNRVSDHYGEDRITGYELTFTAGGKTRGIFRCGCGFAYYRTGRDTAAEDRYKVHGHIAFGEVWEVALREMHAGRNSYAKMATHLGVSTRAVNKRLVQFGLAIPFRNDASQHQAGAVGFNAGRGNPKVDIDPEVLESKRRFFLNTIEANPEAGRCRIRKMIESTYTWLYNHDREWLNAHLPARLASKGPGVKIDWQARDAEFAVKVVAEAKRTMNATGRPVWVSATGVATRIGKKTVISKHANKLPLTVKALKDVAESIEEYAVRRVKWAASSYRDEGIVPSMWQLQQRAAVSNKVAKYPVVKSALEKALLCLDS